MQRNSRNGLLVGFAVSAAVLMMAGTVYACTAYKGKVTITGTGTGSGSHFADGKDGVHEYCGTHNRGTVNMSGTTFTVAVGETTTCIANGAAAETKLPDIAGGYEVRWVLMTPPVPYLPVAYNCNVKATNSGALVNKVVLTGGVGSQSYNHSEIGVVGPVNICVTNAAKPTDVSGPEVFLNIV